MKRLSKTKKWTAAELADMALQNMQADIADKEKPISPKSLDTAISALDSEQAEIYHRRQQAAAWAVVQSVNLTRDAKTALSALSGAVKTVLVSETAVQITENALRAAEVAAADLEQAIILQRAFNFLIEQIMTGFYNWPGLNTLKTRPEKAEKQLQKFTTNAQEPEDAAAVTVYQLKLKRILEEALQRIHSLQTFSDDCVEAAADLVAQSTNGNAPAYTGYTLMQALLGETCEIITDADPVRYYPDIPASASYGLMDDSLISSILRDPAGGQVPGQLSLWDYANEGNGIQVKAKSTYAGKKCKLTKFDCDVIEAVGNIMYYWRVMKGQSYRPLQITVTQIWQIMNGRPLDDFHAHPGKIAREKIEKAIDKLRYTEFTIDALEEVRRYGYTVDEDLVNGTVGRYHIPAYATKEERKDGVSTTKYTILDYPPLYAYIAGKRTAEDDFSKRLLFVPLKSLDVTGQARGRGSTKAGAKIKEDRRETEYLQEFKTYLLREIVKLQKGRRDNNRITLETLYRNTGIPAPADRVNRNDHANETAYAKKIRRERAKDARKIEELLQAWKDPQLQLITGYNPVTHNKEVLAFDVDVKKDKPKKQKHTTAAEAFGDPEK